MLALAWWKHSCIGTQQASTPARSGRRRARRELAHGLGRQPLPRNPCHHTLDHELGGSLSTGSTGPPVGGAHYRGESGVASTGGWKATSFGQNPATTSGKNPPAATLSCLMWGTHPRFAHVPAAGWPTSHAMLDDGLFAWGPRSTSPQQWRCRMQ